MCTPVVQAPSPRADGAFYTQLRIPVSHADVGEKSSSAVTSQQPQPVLREDPGLRRTASCLPADRGMNVQSSLPLLLRASFLGRSAPEHMLVRAHSLQPALCALPPRRDQWRRLSCSCHGQHVVSHAPRDVDPGRRNRVPKLHRRVDLVDQQPALRVLQHVHR